MLAYLNGNWIDYADAAVPVWDYGFAMGASATEQLRTFGGTLFCPEWHIDRLIGGLEIMGLTSSLDRDALLRLANEVVSRNWNKVSDGGDMGVGLCITPGPLTKFAPAETGTGKPTVLAYGYPLNFSGLAESYAHGISLSIVETREVPDACVPKGLKNRSRMHYYLAEQQAAAKSPGSRALLLDMEGNVAEATVATVVIVEDQRLIVPPAAMILPGTALRFLIELCTRENITVAREVISPTRLKMADEIFWLSTPVAMLPVTSVDEQPIGSGKPGAMFQRLINTWSKEVGHCIIKQAGK